MTGSLQVKNGKYYIVLNSYENGKRKPKWIATGLPEKGNKRKAERMLREAISEEEARADEMQPTNILLSDYIRRWLHQIELRVDTVTLQGYTLLAERHILPFFEQKQVRLVDVTRTMIQDFLDEKGRNGRLDGKGGLSPKSVRELKNILNQVFNEAMREEYLSANPCTLIRLPPRALSTT